MDNLKTGVKLFAEGEDLLMGGFSFDKVAKAKDLYAGATSFFRSFKHMGEEQDGLAEGDYATYEREHKMVTMFSGCRDDQTSADANIGGVSEGAMSWAFLETMKRMGNPTYLEVSTVQSLFLVFGLESVPDISRYGFTGKIANQGNRRCKTRGSI